MSVSGISGMNQGALKRWAPNPSRASEQHLLAARASGVNGPYGASNDNAPALLAAATVLNDLTPTFTRANPVATDPVTGLQVAHNLLIQSQTLENVAWSSTGLSSVGTNATAAPDGTTTADALIEDATTGAHRVYQVISYVAGSTYTLSVYLKANNRTSATILMNDGAGSVYVLVDLTNGTLSGQTISASFTNASSTCQYIGNGWYRATITATAGNTGAGNVQLYAATATYTGTNLLSAIYLWGAQLNRGAAATTYVPTTTTAVDGSNVRRRIPLTIGMRQVQGDLIEGSRQNLLTYSQDFSNAAWTKAFSSVTGAAMAPDGTLTAFKLVEDSSNNNHYLGATRSVSATTAYVYSFYIKAGERTKVRMILNDGVNGGAQWDVDLSAGTIGTGSTYGTAGYTALSQSLTPLGGGWYRGHVGITTGAGTSVVCQSYLNNGAGISYAGDGASGLYTWGHQLEAGAFPSSYIPTTTAAVTRSADSLSVSLSSLVDSRTNYLTYSQDFSHANWSKASLAAPVAAQAPDGTMTAWTIAENSSTATHEFYGTVTATAAAWTMSVYLKAGGRKVRLAFGTAGYARGSRVDADPSNGTFANKVDTGGSVGTWSVTLIGGGWYRYSCAIDVASAATWYLDGILLGPGDATSYLGDGTSGVQVFGAQVSPTATAIEYIPTGASAITTGPTGLSLDHGTVLAIYVPYGSGNQAFDRRFAFGTVSGVQKFLIDHDTGNMRAVRYDNTTFRSASVAAVNPSALDARAGVYDSSGARLFRNGIQVAVSASPVMPYTAVDTMQIGSDASAAFHAHGYVALLYWPRALTADEIARVARVSSAPIFAI